jgi:hypothetical protein
MKIIGMTLIVISLVIGILVDNNYFIEIRLPIFSSFIIFLLGIYLLIDKDQFTT